MFFFITLVSIILVSLFFTVIGYFCDPDYEKKYQETKTKKPCGLTEIKEVPLRCDKVIRSVNILDLGR